MKDLHKKKNVTVSFEKNGKLIVGVTKKEPLSILDPKDVIPKILPDGRKTDVIETGKIYMWNRKKYRPLRSGISCCPDDVGAGTLGFIAIDNADNKIVGVSCNHVIGPVYNPNYSTPVGGVLDPTIRVIVQPSPLEDINAEQVGTGKRCVPMAFGTTEVSNSVDAGIFEISGMNMVIPAMCRLWYGGSLPFAESRYEYSVGNSVVKSGRTTYLTQDGIISSHSAYGTTTYGTDTAYFEDVILIESTGVFSQPGDSGSAILCKIGGQYKIIGILYAGNEAGTITLACHIDNIASQLDIREWDGSIFMEQTQEGALLVDGICYHDSGTEIIALPTHSADKAFTDCAECLIDQNRKRLFGNVI